MTLASWYEPENWRGKLFRISNTAGRGQGLRKDRYNWGVVRCLIPDWSLVKAFKQGRVSQTEYEVEYRKGLQQRWSEVSAWLASLSPDEDITLLCHEREGHFCHRRLVAGLVSKYRSDIEVALR